MAKTLVEVLTEYGVELIPSGERYKAYCPFHKDDTPSFTIYPNGTYYCFGIGCEVWGDAVKFLTDKGLTAKEAMEYVGEDYTQPRAEKAKVIKVRNTINTWSFLDSVSTQYHEFLLSIPGAINYLMGRGLTLETIRKYHIGYTDGQVLNLMYSWERQLADEIGVMTRKGYEVMSHRITIPNLLDRGQCDFIMGRTIINDKIKYLGLRMPKPLVGFYEVRKAPIIFLVEGQFDWLTLRQWGYPAVCISGSSTKDFVLKTLSEKEIIIIPDLDDGPGMKAAQTFKEYFGERGTILDYSRLKTDSSKLDVSTLAERSDGEQSFKEVVMENIPWILNLSKAQLNTWFAPLVT